MRIGVIGAGLQGRTVALDLAAAPDVDEVRLGDLRLDVAREVAARAAPGRIIAGELDATRGAAVRGFLDGLDVVVSAASYRLHVELTRAAIAAGVHCCDLGGNNAVGDAQRALDAAARRAGVTVVPDCGLAPGMASILAALAIERHGAATDVRIRVGGLPARPAPPLGYQLVFSVEGLLNEYDQPCRVLRDGEPVELEPLTGIESVTFASVGRLEAFHTSGGASTLPQTYRGRLRELDYKTLRYPGHCDRLRLLRDLGLMDERPRRVAGAEIAPRRLLEALLVERIGHARDDIVLVRVVASGERHGVQVEHVFELEDRGDRARGVTAMMRTTAFPVAVVALFLGRGLCGGPGVVAQELAVPGARFVDELRRRGVAIEERVERRASS